MAYDWETFAVKISAAIAIFLMGLGFGLGARMLTKLPYADTIMCLSNALAGGIFLSLGLTHILPEAVEGFGELDEKAGGLHVGYCFVLLGYVIVLFLDKVLFGEQHEEMHCHHFEDDSALPPSNNDSDPLIEGSYMNDPVAESESLEREHDNHKSGHGHSHGGGHGHSHGGGHGHSHGGGHGHSHGGGHGHSHGDKKVYEKDDASGLDVHARTGTTSFVLLVALGCHSLFEGLACGVQGTPKDTYPLIVGILAHKWAEAVGLGVSLARSNHKAWISVLFVVVFSLSSPVGIIIGEIIKQVANDLMESIAMALAAGSFLYIGATEIVSEEFASRRLKWAKIIVFLIGAGAMILISLGHDHGGHGHSHGGHDHDHDH